MKNLGERNYAIISQGIKGTGSFNPKENFYWFEEELFIDELDIIWEFLAWCHAGGTKRSFGRGNYEERFKDFLNDRNKAIDEFNDHLNSDPNFNYFEKEFHDWFLELYLI